MKPIEVDMVTGVISIADLIPLKEIKSPEGATHFSLSGAYADVNFTSNTSTVAYTNEVNLAINGNSTTVTLTLPAWGKRPLVPMLLINQNYFYPQPCLQIAFVRGRVGHG